MGAYKELKKSLATFNRNNIVAYFRNKKSSLIIYKFNESKEVKVIVCSNGSVLYSSVTICMDEFINDRNEITSDNRVSKSIRKEFSEFCDMYYNLIENLYGRNF